MNIIVEKGECLKSAERIRQGIDPDKDHPLVWRINGEVVYPTFNDLLTMIDTVLDNMMIYRARAGLLQRIKHITSKHWKWIEEQKALEDTAQSNQIIFKLK